VSMIDQYLCLRVHSRPDESEPNFKMRLSAFWTIMLRNHADDFEKVYAETTEFQREGDRLSRQYLIEAPVLSILEIQLRSAGISFDSVDPEDVYSKYEAAPPEWMWIEH